MILSPNCCSVTLLNIHQCHFVTSLFVSSERTRSTCFAKQMVECRFRPPKTSEEEEKCLTSAIRREVRCASSLLNAGVDSKLVRLRTGNF